MQTSLPLLGDTPAFLLDKLAFLGRASTHAEVTRLEIGRGVSLLNTAEDVEHVLVKNAYNYEKTPRLTSERGRRLSGHGLHTATGREHLSQRRLLQPAFHRRVVGGFARAIEASVREWGGERRADEEVDLFAEMMGLTRAIMIRLLLGEEFHDEGGRFAAAVGTRRRYTEYFFTSHLPFPEYWPTPINLRYRRARAYMHRVLDEQIAKRRDAPEPGHDLLSRLVAARHKDGASMNDGQVRDEAVTITGTGYETIGAALSWIWYLLSRHPEAARRVQEEARSSPPISGDPQDDIAALEYTHRVIDEALRLYPPTWIFIRVANEADELPSGTPIVPGDKLYLCPYTVHRLESYFPDPERFDPDRFLAESVRDRPRLAFFPFGAGPKLCIGEALARLEILVILRHLARRMSFDVLDADVVPRPAIVLEPRGGLPARVRLHPSSTSPQEEPT